MSAESECCIVACTRIDESDITGIDFDGHT